MGKEYQDLLLKLVNQKHITTENEDFALDLVVWLKKHLVNFELKYYQGIFTLEIIKH